MKLIISVFLLLDSVVTQKTPRHMILQCRLATGQTTFTLVKKQPPRKETFQSYCSYFCLAFFKPLNHLVTLSAPK